MSTRTHGPATPMRAIRVTGGEKTPTGTEHVTGWGRIRDSNLGATYPVLASPPTEFAALVAYVRVEEAS
jgi:hypothetical protein